MTASDDLAKSLSKYVSGLGGMLDFSKALRNVSMPFFQPAFLTALRDLSSANTMAMNYQSTFARLSKEMSASLSGMTQYQTALQSLTRSMSIPFVGYQEIYGSTLRAIDALQKSLNTTFLAPNILEQFQKMRLSGIAETVAALNYQMSTPSGAIEDSVLAPELDGIRQVGEASNLDQIEEQFSNIENNLIARIKQIPRLRISFEGWLNLLLMIFIFIYSTIASDQFQGRFEGKVDAIARLDVRILESQKRIYESFMDHMKESDLTGTFYIALHKANLKARPSNKSLTISTIYPNQLLKLEKRKSKWIYVTYFDYVKGISCKGWVLKKYLKMVRS